MEGNDMENKTEKQIVFYPDFLFKEAVAALVIVIAVVAMALLMPLKVGDPADPSDSAFKPRPEWYFMAPFYLLKIFPSSLEIVPTVIAPLFLFALLIIFPFFDKNSEIQPRKRPVAMGLMAFIVIATVIFTILGIRA
jgi:quinol-cytochrome oxidoreductase complex cytochrome b subunit